MLAFLGVLLGILLLLAGGAVLVRGASEVAAGMGVSPMVVGLTIVGFGTSAPELVVNVVGAIRGATDIAFGNVIGSNISNLGLILGAAAIFRPIAIRGDLVRRELPLLLLATTLILVMVLDQALEGRTAVIGRTDAIVLILIFCIFIYITVLDFIRTRREDPLLADLTSSRIIVAPPKGRLSWLLLAAGFALLFVGGEVTIRYGVDLARHVGMSPAVIGMFVIGMGTSLPELVTTVIAAIRRESDLALGNIIGSNIFNSLMVLPTSGVISEIPMPDGGVGDIIVSWLLAALLIPIFFIGRALLGRRTGALLLLIYVGYAVYRVGSQ